MLTIRNIEKLNGFVVQKINSTYKIKEVVEGPQYYHFEIKIIYGANADREFEILLDRSKDPALNRYLMMESINGKSMWVLVEDINTPRGVSVYIDLVANKTNLC